MNKVKISLIKMNLYSLGAYLASYYLFNNYNFQFPINILGLFVLLFLIPYNISQAFNLEAKSHIEKYFTYLSIFFLIITPLFFSANKLAGVPLNTFSVFIASFSIIFICNAYIYLKKRASFLEFDYLKLTAILKDNWVLIIAFLSFSLLHLINFYFYKFIPEGDSYIDLVKINKIIEIGNININYREFFLTSLSLLSILSKINIYIIFSFWAILLQSSILFTLYAFLKEFKITDKTLQLIVLISSISIPSVNMEIDAVRPQNFLLILVPIYFYFIYKYVKQKKISYLIFSTLITVLGINFHQFFLLLFFSHSIVILKLLWNKYMRSDDKKIKTIFILSTATAFLFLYIILSEIIRINYTLSSSLGYFNDIYPLINNPSNWRIWFLGNYATSSEQMGWPGFLGAVKYYSYYLSPLLIFFSTVIIYLGIKKRDLFKNNLFKICFPFLMILLFFAEILPRLNRPLLPERFWILIDLTLLILFIPFLSFLMENKLLKKIFIYLSIILIFINLSGSFYVAKGKGGDLISKEDIEAVDWIKRNTSPDSIFITQSSNDALFVYFAQRKMIGALPKEIFSENNIIDLYKKDVGDFGQQQAEASLNFTKKIDELSKDQADPKAVANETKLFNSKNQLYKKEIEYRQDFLTHTAYIYYSKKRFDNIYSQREWWRIKNYYSLDLEKLNQMYQLVYQKDGVYIWSVN